MKEKTKEILLPIVWSVFIFLLGMMYTIVLILTVI